MLEKFVENPVEKNYRTHFDFVLMDVILYLYVSID
jgi:hypothetical protein